MDDEQFSRLLLDKCGVKADQRVIQDIVLHRASQLAVIASASSALVLYRAMQKLPHSSTKRRCHGLVLDGEFLPVEGCRSTLIQAWKPDSVAPLVLKVASAIDLQREYDVWHRMHDVAASSCLIPAMEVIRLEHSDKKGEQHPFGLLMPRYVSSLAAFLGASSPMSPQQLQLVFTSVSTAAEALHGRQRVHCDIKPANIFVDSLGGIVLADYGRSVDFSFHCLSKDSAFGCAAGLALSSMRDDCTFSVCCSALVQLLRTGAAALRIY